MRDSFRSLHDTTIAQYEIEREKVDREIARLPPTLEAYEKMRAADRQYDASHDGIQQSGSISHSLAFHLQKQDDQRDIYSVDDGQGGIEDTPLSFQKSTIDSRFPSPTTASRGNRVPGMSASLNGGGSVVSKKLTKAEKEEKKAWDLYDKFVARDELFAKMEDIQKMEDEIETRLASDALTDRERQELSREVSGMMGGLGLIGCSCALSWFEMMTVMMMMMFLVQRNKHIPPQHLLTVICAARQDLVTLQQLRARNGVQVQAEADGIENGKGGQGIGRPELLGSWHGKHRRHDVCDGGELPQGGGRERGRSRDAA